MSIFESLLNESDEIVKKAGILDLVFADSRKKVSDILFDNNTECKVKTNANTGILSITYQNGLGKVILTPKGIDRMDDSGTTWSVTEEKVPKSQ